MQCAGSHDEIRVCVAWHVDCVILCPFSCLLLLLLLLHVEYSSGKSAVFLGSSILILITRKICSPSVTISLFLSLLIPLRQHGHHAQVSLSSYYYSLGRSIRLYPAHFCSIFNFQHSQLF